MINVLIAVALGWSAIKRARLGMALAVTSSTPLAHFVFNAGRR
jgi:hypothetical protein